MKKLFLLLLAFPLANKGMAQIGLTLTTGPKWQDASVYRDMRSGYEYYAEANYANHPTLGAMAWSTSGGFKFYNKSVLLQKQKGLPISQKPFYLFDSKELFA